MNLSTGSKKADLMYILSTITIDKRGITAMWEKEILEVLKKKPDKEFCAAEIFCALFSFHGTHPTGIEICHAVTNLIKEGKAKLCASGTALMPDGHPYLTPGDSVGHFMVKYAKV